MCRISFFLLVFLSLNVFSQELQVSTYTDGDFTLNGLVTSNQGQKLPGVLILPAWLGIDDEAKKAALALEKEGYIAFIADIYGNGNVPETTSTAKEKSDFFKNNYSLYQKRINLALHQLRKKGAIYSKVAVIGFCFGGTGALEAARGQLPVAGVVSIHGGLSKDPKRSNKTLKTKILVEHGAEDQSVTAEDMTAFLKELKDGNADWQFITYANSKHTFTNPLSPDYNASMANRAWQHTLLFLKELLK